MRAGQLDFNSKRRLLAAEVQTFRPSLAFSSPLSLPTPARVHLINFPFPEPTWSEGMRSLVMLSQSFGEEKNKETDWRARVHESLPLSRRLANTATC